MANFPTTTTFSECMYRLLLYLYPAQHRREYGPFMAQVFRDMCWHTVRTHGRQGLAGLWMHTLADVAVSALREHLDNVRDVLRINKEQIAMKQANHSRLVFGQITNMGMVRQSNEDVTSARFFPVASSPGPAAIGETEIALLLVMDGLGGHAAGRQAAEYARSLIEAYIEQALKLAEDNAEKIMGDAFRAAHAALRKEWPESGACATAALILDGHIILAHTGDTRAYLLADGKLTQMTTDHLLPVEDDQPSVILTRVLGMPARVEADTNGVLELDVLTRRLPPGAALLLCSDGLWRVVDDSEIHAVMDAERDPNTICERLITLANERGGEDNIAVLAARTQ